MRESLQVLMGKGDQPLQYQEMFALCQALPGPGVPR